MKIQKRLISLIVCVVLLVCALPLTAAAEDDFPAILAEAKKGVVQIYALYYEDNYMYSSKGTGFAVGDPDTDATVFLTNWHVVTSSGKFPVGEARVWILQENCSIDENNWEPDPAKSISCEVLKTTDGHPDYAIIRATETVEGYKPLPLQSSEDVPDGTEVYALGYPAVVEETSVSRYGINDITPTDGIISKHMQYVQEDNNWVLLHTAKISEGNSGGPLITKEGVVVGLNTYGYRSQEAMETNYYAVYSDYAMEGLDELDLPYERIGDGNSDKDSDSDSDDPEWKSTAVIGGAVLVAVIVVLLALKKKKEREEEQRRQEAERHRMEEERRRAEEERRRMEEERRRQEDAQRRREEDQRRREQEVKARVQLSGGGVYPVIASGCVIGRERDCGIVLPEGMPGVSRHHCRLEFRSGQLILTDLNSSYGTYIHGKRVPPNTPVALKGGSSFCLGSEKCRFTVC